jgi:hypothetical protein
LYSTVYFKHIIKNTSVNKYINTTIENSDITNPILYKSIFDTLESCSIKNKFENVEFKKLINCTFNAGLINNTVCYNDIVNKVISESEIPLLYDISKQKELYVTDGNL